jgi:hypothetical protein
MLATQWLYAHTRRNFGLEQIEPGCTLLSSKAESDLPMRLFLPGGNRIVFSADQYLGPLRNVLALRAKVRPGGRIFSDARSPRGAPVRVHLGGQERRSHQLQPVDPLAVAVIRYRFTKTVNRFNQRRQHAPRCGFESKVLGMKANRR